MRDVNAILASPNLQDIKRRFFAKIKEQPNGCHEWVAAKHQFGYGDVTIDGRSEGAHRVAWVLANGPLPELPGPGPTMVCHTCDNPPCCNPAHLFVGKARNNTWDKVAKNRDRNGRNHPRTNMTLEIAKAVKAYKGSAREAAEVFGISRRRASAIKNDETWKSPETVAYFKKSYARGETHHSAKLTRAQAASILADGRSNVAIAAEYGVSGKTVGQIKRGLTWKCLQEPDLDKLPNER